jgi:hypothetical protein
MKKTAILSGLSLLFGFSSCHDMKLAKNVSDKYLIGAALKQLTQTEKSRNHLNTDALNETASYIFSVFEKYCDTVYYQNYDVNGITYKNVVARMGKQNKKRLVIGAHYDVAGNQPGADDNASGVAGLLELARLLKVETLEFPVEFVAYTLEEPPYFRTENMGSFIHAKSLKDAEIQIKGMICLEMIGYFNDTPGSQKFPLRLLRLFYGNKGNFITVVQKFNNGRFGEQVKKLMMRQKLVQTKAFTAPRWLANIDFSDHQNYWRFGYNAVMITNTAFYRNPHYHKPTDTPETLDLERMCKVVDQVCNCILNL